MHLITVCIDATDRLVKVVVFVSHKVKCAVFIRVLLLRTDLNCLRRYYGWNCYVCAVRIFGHIPL